MKKLLRVFGCGKRKTTSLTKTATSSGNNASSQIDHMNNSLSVQKTEKNNIDNDNTNKTQKKEIIIEEEENNNNIHIQSKEESIDDQWLLPKDSHFITDYEKGIIEFSPNGLGKFVETLDQLPGFKTLFNKQNLEILINMSGSPITTEFCLIKTIYKQKKSELGSNANVQNILRLMFRAEDRANWDKVLKLVKRYEGDDKMFIIRTWAISFPLISEREALEKRMIFKYKGISHVFSTSVKPDVTISL